jgi:hypothetical protein
VTGGELDHPVGDARDLPVVRDDEHRTPGIACAWSRSRIWMPVWKSSSPVGSSASRIGFPLASGARSLPLLLAAQQLVGEVSRSLGEPDAIQHLARYPRT